MRAAASYNLVGRVMTALVRDHDRFASAPQLAARCQLRDQSVRNALGQALDLGLVTVISEAWPARYTATDLGVDWTAWWCSQPSKET